MSMKSSLALFVSLAILGGCAQLDAWTDTSKRGKGSAVPEPGDTAFLEGEKADEVYVNSDSAAGSADYRNVYIAPANLANMQVIRPEGGTADIEWWITDEEDSILQSAILEQYTVALSYGSAFYIVASREEAQIIVETAVVALHPNETRAAIAAGGKPGGAVTVSIALLDAASGKVLVRAVDTRTSDDIWAFNQVENDDPALDLIFRAWGNSIRRGMLQLQGRANDSEAPSLMSR